MKNSSKKFTIVILICLFLVSTQTKYVTADSPPIDITRDIILIVDTTTVMSYETGGTSPSPDSPFDNPEYCNPRDNCQPFRAIKDSLVEYINLLSFPNDRVGVIALTSQVPGGSRNPMVVLPLSSDKTAVLAVINNLKVFQPPICDWGGPASPSKGPCINYTSENIFSGFRCPIYELGDDLISETGDEPGNPSSCTQTDVGTPLSLASTLFAQGSSADSQKIIIPLIAGRANASQGDLNFPDGYCPESTWLSPWCNDIDPDVRHIPSDINYDADDYARDMADLIATPNTCSGIKIFSLGIGYNVLANNGTAEKLLQYIALDAGGSSASHGMYYFIPTIVTLSNVLELLAISDFCPTTNSITLVNSTPTSSSSVDFTVTFSESVQNVDVNDFSLTTTGVSSASITGVTPVSASVYTVSVNTGSGNGTIRLDVPNTASIKDLSNNNLSGLPFTSGETYTIDKSGGSLPTTATFGDTPMNHPYWADIEILYANGFTGGCSSSPLLFCPETTMDRAQGAVFMLRGLVGTSYVPPVEPFANPFGDSWSSGPWAQRWAQGMLDEGLTAGCSASPLLYCPWEQMPRAQAAVFGMRLLNGSAYVPPAGTGTVFADINGSEWYAGWAEQAYLNGLLPACGMQGSTPLFCPNSLVSRGLGAYMIVRARNLSMP